MANLKDVYIQNMRDKYKNMMDLFGFGDLAYLCHTNDICCHLFDVLIDLGYTVDDTYYFFVRDKIDAYVINDAYIKKVDIIIYPHGYKGDRCFETLSHADIDYISLFGRKLGD